MACGYRYAGGYRVNFYARYQSTSGGLGGLLSGKTLGSALAGAVGLSNSPQQFIEASIKKLEALFAASNWAYNIVEMTPALEGKTVVPDPLLVAQAAAERKKTDRAARLAARTELQKLGMDASDRARFIRAVESGDEDVVALYLEAGAVDVNAPDATGKRVRDYATKRSVKELLGG